MKDEGLVSALKELKVNTGSLVCFGCGHEHNCGIHGCAIINAAVAELERVKDAARGEHPERGEVTVRAESNCDAVEQAAMAWGVPFVEICEQARVWRLEGQA